jgi:hypothetical protein
MNDPGGNEQIDGYLRDALNIAWVELGGNLRPITLDEAITYLTSRLLSITPWPDAPSEAFPFVQKSGTQEGE